jgi:acetyl-CoA synthetase
LKLAQADVTGTAESAESALAQIEVLAKEHRSFPVPDDFKSQALITDDSLYRAAEEDFEGFWLDQAKQLVDWFKEPTRSLEWDPPHCTWFADGELNVSYNCLDKHIDAGRGDKIAYHFVPEPIEEEPRPITFSELRDEVCRFANGLKELGVKRGDRVGIYMGMVPELPIAMLACSRIGAPHVVVFGGFSADSLAERMDSTGASVLITQDEARRKGGLIPLKHIADQALEKAPSIKKMVVLRRTGGEIPMTDERDVWWHDLIDGKSSECEPEHMGAEDILYLLHTSGTTAKPKAAQHTTGGYLAYASATHKWVFDIHDDDVWWCAADVGWVTGHTYIVYGPLNNGTTGVLYEGDPTYPDVDRHWAIIEQYKVNQYYTAPTLIRAFIKSGPEPVQRHDLSSLKLLGTVGEPINPEAWLWYWKYVGGERCPVVDTWWQTETGGILISPLPGVTTLKPGSATKPLPGVQPAVLDEKGKEVPQGEGGFLVLKKPWPGIFRTLWNDDERYVSNYFSKYGPDTYFVGDGARLDEDGDFWLLGRIDDVMNVSGHRLSTIELESALVAHEAVAEAAAAAAPDDLTGQTPLCFVILKSGYEPTDELAKELREFVGEQIGKIARPKAVIFGADLPKTRSGKIMRRLLKDIAEGNELGDTTTLRDPDIVEELKGRADELLGRTGGGS